MASAFKPFIASATHEYEVHDFVVDSAQTFTANELVVVNTSDGELEVCGADPALIAGLSLAPASVSRNAASAAAALYGRLPVAVLTPDVLVGMSSSTTPAATHVGNVYGVEKTGNNWRVDIGDTSNTRVVVVKIDIANGIFFVRLLAANLQFDAIAS